MENIIMLIVMALQVLFSGGTAAGNQDYNNMNWLQLMALMGNNNASINWYQDNWSEIDKTIELSNEQWEQYGYGEGSTVRVHGNLNSGLYFDFSLKGSQWNNQQQVVSPVEGVTITQTSYSSSDTGYSVSVGPISLKTALTLWRAATTSTLQNAG